MKRVFILLVFAMAVTGLSVSPCLVKATSTQDPLAYASSDLTPYVGEDTLEKDQVISGRVSLTNGRPAGGQKVRVEKKIQYQIA